MNRSVSAQQGRDADLGFMLEKLRSAYAGYADKVKPDEFRKLVEELRESKGQDSFLLYSRLTGYFKDDHLAVFAVLKLHASDSNESRMNLKKISLAAGHTLPPAAGGLSEGYWLDELGNEILYLRQTGADRWEGDVVETKAKVPAGFRVLTLYREKDGWLADYIDAALHYRVVIPAHLKSPAVLIGRCYFKYKKIEQYSPGMLAKLPSFSYQPSASRLDSQTLLIRMPYFLGSLAKKYDSLIKANAAALGQVSTLILDIRNNPGGSVSCFDALRPYVCTGPVRESDAYQLCSTDLIADARSDLQDYEQSKDSVKIRAQQATIDSMVRHKDSLWFQKGADSPCMPPPNSIKRVAILMDHGSRSAAELMVLYFRQSAKVRLFGENSAGAIDYLDLLTYELPRSGFQFWVATSKRVLTAHDPAYDATGIPPDIQIPETETDWIGFVRKYYLSTTEKP